MAAARKQSGKKQAKAKATAKPRSSPKPKPRRRASETSPVEAARPRILVLVNEKSGTVRSRGPESVRQLVETTLQPHFAAVDVKLFQGDIMPELTKARDGKTHDIIVAGGGDGTLASAAGALMDSGVTMGVLPLGTMNLYAQALGFSPKLEEAVGQLAQAVAKPVDVGQANGRAFLHQVSLGLQPRMAKLRERMGYSSRLTKMLGSLRAFTVLMLNPRTVRVEVDAAGSRSIFKTPLLVISNNLLGASQNVSLQEKLDDGVLGLYVLRDVSLRTLLRLARAYLSGSLPSPVEVKMSSAPAYTVTRLRSRLPGRRPKPGTLASMDGEVLILQNPIKIEIRPKSLQVLVAPGKA